LGKLENPDFGKRRSACLFYKRTSLFLPDFHSRFKKSDKSAPKTNFAVSSIGFYQFKCDENNIWIGEAVIVAMG